MTSMASLFGAQVILYSPVPTLLPLHNQASLLLSGTSYIPGWASVTIDVIPLGKHCHKIKSLSSSRPVPRAGTMLTHGKQSKNT